MGCFGLLGVGGCAGGGPDRGRPLSWPSGTGARLGLPDKTQGTWLDVHFR